MRFSQQHVVTDEPGSVRAHAQGTDTTQSDDVGQFPILGGVMSQSSLLALQRGAGNAAVSALLASRSSRVRRMSVRNIPTSPATVIQRCGASGCDCAVDDIQTPPQLSALPIQRQTAVGEENLNASGCAALTPSSSSYGSATALDGHHAAAKQTASARAVVYAVPSRVGHHPMVQRQAGPTFTAPPDVPTPGQTRELVPAVTAAQKWLQDADSRLSAYGSGSPRSAPSQATARSMLQHFASSDQPTTRYVQNIIRLVADRLRTDFGAPSLLTVRCHGSSDPLCGGAAAAYVQGGLLVFCPTFFGSDQVWRVTATIHEIAHSIVSGGPMHITDRAYRSDRLYGSLSTGEALTNAESYALLVRELATGAPIYSTAPIDTYEDCPTDWRGALFSGIARAQRWNRDAQVVAHDNRPGFLSQWTALATTFLGGQSPAQVAAAATVYDEAETKLGDRVDFECETAGGGRCDTSSTYWYAAGDFHICPSWRTRPTDDDRAEALLSGLYGYYRIVDDNRRRSNLAALARSLHYQFWAPPSAADVSNALASAGARPQPPAAPPPGPIPAL